jgi:hypothetical protein
LPELCFVPLECQGLAYTLGGVIHLLENLLTVALERQTKLAIHVVVEETVSRVELQQQHARFATAQIDKFFEQSRLATARRASEGDTL